MTIVRLDAIGLNVSDLQRSAIFYHQALGFTPVGPAYDMDPVFARLLGAPGARAIRLRLGSQEIELSEMLGAAPYPPDSTAADLWFQHFAIVTTEIGLSYARLGDTGVISDNGPQRLPRHSGGVTAYKFRDPDGHPLELIQYPDRTNMPGIDHSAISVSDVPRSIAYYRALGFALGPHQINNGPEQDRLDGLDDVRVEVVALSPATATPHLELLGYERPRGRSRPLDPLDIAASRLILTVDHSSPNATTLRDGSAVELLRDPDGHYVLLTSR